MIYRFAEFEVDTRLCELRRNGRAVALEPQVFDLLAHLVANPGRLVTKQELFDTIWHGRFVSDAALSSRIKAARQAIGDDGTAQTHIRTHHGRGFRFVTEVERVEERVPDEAAGLPGLLSPGAGEPAPTPPSDRPSLAVLPFRFLGDPGDQGYLAEAIVEEVTSALSRVRSFLVIARSSAGRFRDPEADAAAVAGALGVRYLVQGTVRRRAGGEVRVSVQLIDAPAREEVWNERFEAPPDALFDLEERISERIVGALEPGILAAEMRRLRRQRAQTPSAYELVLRALPEVWALSPPANARARALLEEAIALDRDYGLAHALLSWCHGQPLVYNWPLEDAAASRRTALELARRAARLDPDDPLVLILLATAECVAGEVGAAALHVARGLALDPNSAWGWNRSGFVHCYLGEPDTAVAHFERSLRLSPLDPLRYLAYVGLGLAAFVAERYDDATGWIEKALLENPEIVWVHRLLAACAAMAGERERARRSVAIVESYAPDIDAEQIVGAIPHQSEAVRARYREALLRAGFRPARAPAG